MKTPPCQIKVNQLVEDLRLYLFKDELGCKNISLECLKENFNEQLKLAIEYTNCDLDYLKISEQFFAKIDELIIKLHNDALAGFNGDPAANSISEIILAYPGMFAITTHRIAHELYLLNVRLLSRMMQEYAHSKTGIDIHPGATIGDNFFIDHGTGVVIGETTIIGNNVKIYQGVTLGALSLSKGQGLKNIKRHPTIEDNVVIYANATILGGETVIGENTIIGGNTFIYQSIDKNKKVFSEYKMVTR
ncbi:MAG: serine O-acetyltransferase EpsC [Bacilli bacterium]|nr:serine O-acetyltransferase EpsC [Bacilli bacterium]